MRLFDYCTGGRRTKLLKAPDIELAEQVHHHRLLLPYKKADVLVGKLKKDIALDGYARPARARPPRTRSSLPSTDERRTASFFFLPQEVALPCESVKRKARAAAAHAAFAAKAAKGAKAAKEAKAAKAAKAANCCESVNR